MSTFHQTILRNLLVAVSFLFCVSFLHLIVNGSLGGILQWVEYKYEEVFHDSLSLTTFTERLLRNVKYFE
jgi:hypothetical protein